MTRNVRFVKMEGIGNDFIVVPAELLADCEPAQVAIRLCNRHFGIGADGLLAVGESRGTGAAFSFRMYNPDGTPDMCGNGLRCAALFARLAGFPVPQSGEFFIESEHGLHRAEIVEQGDRRAVVRVELGVPLFAPGQIPFADAEQSSVIDYPLFAGDAPVTITAVNTGSTHAVVFANELPGEQIFQTVSPLIENHPYFPDRTSVMWATKSSATEFTLRIWERAASETLGCGTGACAVAAAAIIKGLANFGDRIEIVSKGGSLTVIWSTKDAPIELIGPARWVFEGQTKRGF